MLQCEDVMFVTYLSQISLKGSYESWTEEHLGFGATRMTQATSGAPEMLSL